MLKQTTRSLAATGAAAGIILLCSGCGETAVDQVSTPGSVQTDQVIQDAAPTPSLPVDQETDGDATPVELGQVAWGRDLEQARSRSDQSGKPVLVLFQEVPG